MAFHESPTLAVSRIAKLRARKDYILARCEKNQRWTLKQDFGEQKAVVIDLKKMNS